MPHAITDWLERRENTEDMAHGLPVIIFARWILVVAGLGLALWNAENLVELQVSVVLILGLAVGNFFLHAQLLKREPIRAEIVYGASAADLAIISTILIVTGQFPSTPYVFYLPALLAISVTFGTRVTFVYTVAVLATYGLIAATTGGSEDGAAAAVLTHLLILAAVPVCGNIYWRMERDRRVTSTDVREALGGQIENAGAATGS